MIYSDTKVESMKEQLKQYNNEIKELSDSHKEKDKRKNEIHREVEKLNGDIAELEKENRKLDFEKKEIADKHNPLTGKRVELETALEKDAHEKSILAEQMKLPDFWTALATRMKSYIPELFEGMKEFDEKIHVDEAIEKIKGSLEGRTYNPISESLSNYKAWTRKIAEMKLNGQNIPANEMAFKNDLLTRFIRLGAVEQHWNV